VPRVAGGGGRGLKEGNPSETLGGGVGRKKRGLFLGRALLGLPMGFACDPYEEKIIWAVPPPGPSVQIRCGYI